MDLEQMTRERDAWSNVAQMEFRRQKKQAFEAGRKVKALEWTLLEEEDEADSFVAISLVNPHVQYHVFHPAYVDGWNVFMSGQKALIASGLKTKEEAMAVAQDHHDAAIHAILVHATASDYNCISQT